MMRQLAAQGNDIMEREFTLTTGALSRESEASEGSVRHYANLGLIEFRLASNGARLYPKTAIERVRAIKSERMSKRGRRPLG